MGSIGTGKRTHKVTAFHELFLTVPSCKVASLCCQGTCRVAASCRNSITAGIVSWGHCYLGFWITSLSFD